MPDSPADMADSSPIVTDLTPLLHDAKNKGNREDSVDGMAHRSEPPMSWRHRPSVFWLLGPFTIFMIASGGTQVPEINLIVELVCSKHFAEQQLQHPDLSFTPVIAGDDNPQCKEPGPQKKVATFMLVSNLVAGIMSAIVTPKLGHLSDRYGRTRLLALTSCGGLLKELIFIVAAEFPNYIHYRWIILGSLFEGLAGSTAAANTLSQSYTSDCTAPSKRAVIFGFMTACLYVGLGLGPLLAGFIVEWTGSLISIFYIAFFCHLFFIVFTAFIIPESLSRERQKTAREAWEKEKRTRRSHDGSKSKSWWSTIRAWNPLLPIKILWPTGPGTSPRLRINLIALAAATASLVGATSAMGPVVLLYTELMFHWGNLETSQFVSVVALTRVIALVAVSPAINYIWRTRPKARRRRETGKPAAAEESSGVDAVDIWVLRVSLGLEILGAVGCALARKGSTFVWSILLASFQGVGGATIQSMVTKHFPPERVGQVLGAVGTMGALARVLSPVMFDGTYALAVDSFPQVVFVVLGSLLLLTLIFTLFIRIGVYWGDVKQYDDTPRELIERRSGDDAGRRVAVAEEEEGLLQAEMLASR